MVRPALNVSVKIFDLPELDTIVVYGKISTLQLRQLPKLARLTTYLSAKINAILIDDSCRNLQTIKLPKCTICQYSNISNSILQQLTSLSGQLTPLAYPVLMHTTSLKILKLELNNPDHYVDITRYGKLLCHLKHLKWVQPPINFFDFISHSFITLRKVKLIWKVHILNHSIDLQPVSKCILLEELDLRAAFSSTWFLNFQVVFTLPKLVHLRLEIRDLIEEEIKTCAKWQKSNSERKLKLTYVSEDVEYS
jgi:hypothetical protein